MSEQERSPEEISVLWEDADILVLNKSAGLLTIEDGYNRSLPSVRSLLNQRYDRIWIVHRLDKETSGALVVARSAAAHRSLNRQFEERQVRKEYHAIVCGVPAWDDYTVEIPLRVNGDRRHRTVVDTFQGQPATTTLRKIAFSAGLSLLQSCPHSGYRHQIRAHLRAISLSILNDRLYTLARSQTCACQPELIGRLALHARSIRFTHPGNGNEMSLCAPYPPDFQRALLHYRLVTPGKD